ncbi:ATP-dependent DNA helicase MER3 [Clarireedia jacksonii]
MMDRELDPSLQQILDNASGIHHQGIERPFSNDHCNNEPPLGFTFQPAPRQHGQESSLIREQSMQGYHYNGSKYLSRSTSNLHELQLPAPYSAPNTQGRLTFPPRNSHVFQQADSNVFNDHAASRVLTSADNYFKVLQDLDQSVPRSHPSLPCIPTARHDQNQQPSPITQLANNMFSQTSMPLPRSKPQRSQNIFQTESNKIRELQPQKQQFTPPFTLSNFTYTPDRTNLSVNSFTSPPYQGSSPSARVSQRRNSSRRLSGAPSNEVIQSPHTPEDQTSPNGRYAPPSRTHTYPTHERSVGSQPSSGYSTGRFGSDSQVIAPGNAPPIAHGVQLVSPHELPDRFRQVFPYELFNAVQSKCYTPIYKTNDNIVVSAPTGSGKTALLELAVCRLVESHGSDQFKIVYQAPIKSLCSERLRDWTKKFSHLNLKVAELTGDTSHLEMSKVGSASIIVTTPEKWDSITRKWKDYQKLLQLVKLFLIDEVHILKDIRGATLEAVVSRMKSQGASVRFVALSATVPNSEDIATWLGKDSVDKNSPAHRETFGEEFRPVKLQKHVYGYESRTNDFAFEKILDGKLPTLIQKYSCKKPIMVFCFTRKSCEGTAAILAEHWTRQRPTDRAWPAPSAHTVVETKELQDLVRCGVAYHHAGLDTKDRCTIEAAYLKGDISVICCTSTLAVGVNLPCHLVVLKGTVCFQDSGLVEYSDLEVMQMLGRAGRPQFDDSAIAIIMTRLEKADHYKKMISGQDVLESTLHLNLIEHLNSEIGLGTIHNLYCAKEWLGRTFLSVRMRRNPDYYKLSGILPSRNTDRQLELVCERDITLLQNFNLVTKETEEGIFRCTEYGEAMSRYMVQFETMKLLLSIPRHAKMEKILHIICQAAEFKDLRMKPNERSSLREFNKSPMLKYPIKENISTTAHKIFLMVQVQLGGIETLSSNDFRVVSRQLARETGLILDRFHRLIRCVVDCKAIDCDGISTRCALDLARSVAAGYWENSSLQLRQVTHIGPALARKLASSNINTIEKLASLDTAGIERVVGRNPPFGKKMKDGLAKFPQLKLNAKITGRAFSKVGTSPKVKVSVSLGYKNKQIPQWHGKVPAVSFLAETSDGVLAHFWRGNIKRLSNGYEVTFNVELSSPSDEIKCYISCDEIVGTMQSSVLKPEIPKSDFPSPRVLEKPDAGHAQYDNPEMRDEFGDDIDEDAMLAAVQQVERNDHSEDDFVDIDNVDASESSNRKRADEVEYLEPVRMQNGKWACNHYCRDGHPLKNGQLCKHKCCREGLDKPRKMPRKKSNLSTADDQSEKGKGDERLKATVSKPGMSAAVAYGAKQAPIKYKKSLSHSPAAPSSSGVEVIDLSKTLTPVSYSQVAPREYQKLHDLHTRIKGDRAPSIRMPKQTPQFLFGNGKLPDLPFMEETVSREGDKAPVDPFDSDEYELPSPTTVVSSIGKKKYVQAGQEPVPPTIVADQPEDHAGSEFGDGEISDLEAAMIGLDDSVLLMPTTPKMTSSFANDVFDFAAFNSEDMEQFSSPLMSDMRKRKAKEETPGGFVDPPMKRHQSSPWMRDFQDQTLLDQDSGFQGMDSPTKMTTPGKLGITQLDGKEPVMRDAEDEGQVGNANQTTEPSPQVTASIPLWASEIDANIIDDYLGIVDFVD